MKIDKAIKILENYPVGASPDESVEFNQAIQLGKEALKRFKLFRQGHFNIHLDPLPGETKE